MRRPFIITREMEEARARLEAYKDKIQPYSVLPKENLLLPQQPNESPWSRDQWQSVQQLRAQILHLNNKVIEMRAEKKKPRGKY